MLLVCSAIVAGIALLVWSADRFVDGAASVARRCGMPPLLVGIAIVGFGTSAPEMLVSGVSAWQGNAGIALGNAFGSNIANIALILVVTALVRPIPVKREILFRELRDKSVQGDLPVGNVLELRNYRRGEEMSGSLCAHGGYIAGQNAAAAAK